jgi:type III restriction enzyme
VPPCFIIVCQNTAISKLVYDFISGFHRKNEDGTTTLENGRLALFRNFDETTATRSRVPTPCSLTASNSKPATPSTTISAPWPPTRSNASAAKSSSAPGCPRRRKPHRSGIAPRGHEHRRQARPARRPIRCVVSVSMLTEGWDANTVTHVLGIRAFGTQLLCEQVIGRALRRQSYDLNEDGPDKGLFNVEYADVFGIPFDFTAKPVIAPPSRRVRRFRSKPSPGTRRPRNPLPPRRRLPRRTAGGTPHRHLQRRFHPRTQPRPRRPVHYAQLRHHRRRRGPESEHLGDMRPSTLLFHVTQRLLYTKWRDPGEEPKLHLFGQLKRITKQWLDNCLVAKAAPIPPSSCIRNWRTWPAIASPRGITNALEGRRPIKALLDPYNPTGSSAPRRFQHLPRRPLGNQFQSCQVNWVVLDSDWEAEFCRVAESHPKVRAYVKNHNLGLEVPYRYGSEIRKYLPDFIVLVDDGHGPDDLLHLVVEIKGYRREDAKEKKATMETYWVPGVNNLKQYGRWAFAEFTVSRCSFSTKRRGRMSRLPPECASVSRR